MQPTSTRHDAPADTGSGDVAASLHTITRRTALAGASAVAAAAVGAIPAAALADNPDAKLFALERERLAAKEASKRTSAEWNAAFDKLPDWCREPIRVQIGTTARRPDFIPQPVTACSEEEIRGFRGSGGSDSSEDAEWCEAMNAKLRERKAEEQTERDKVNLGELGARSDAAGDRICEIENQIAASPAHTVEGVALKMRLGLRVMGYEDEPGEPSWAAKLFTSILEDVGRLGRVS